MTISLPLGCSELWIQPFHLQLQWLFCQPSLQGTMNNVNNTHQQQYDYNCIYTHTNNPVGTNLWLMILMIKGDQHTQLCRALHLQGIQKFRLKEPKLNIHKQKQSRFVNRTLQECFFRPLVQPTFMDNGDIQRYSVDLDKVNQLSSVQWLQKQIDLCTERDFSQRVETINCSWAWLYRYVWMKVREDKQKI